MNSPCKIYYNAFKLLEFIYIVFGLKFDVTYNIETDTYTVGFTTFEQSLNSNVIARLTNVNKVNFEPATEFSYTNIKAGYTPKEDSHLGNLNITIQWSLIRCMIISMKIY